MYVFKQGSNIVRHADLWTLTRVAALLYSGERMTFVRAHEYPRDAGELDMCRSVMLRCKRTHRALNSGMTSSWPGTTGVNMDIARAIATMMNNSEDDQ